MRSSPSRQTTNSAAPTIGGCINGALALKVPVEVIRTKCAQYMRHGNPTHLAARLHATDYSIVTQYQAEYRGLVQYYLMAFNVHRLWHVHRVMQLSLVKTLANKHCTSVNKIFHTYRATVDSEVNHGTVSHALRWHGCP
jgi:hypothetical protein